MAYQQFDLSGPVGSQQYSSALDLSAGQTAQARFSSAIAEALYFEISRNGLTTRELIRGAGVATCGVIGPARVSLVAKIGHSSNRVLGIIETAGIAEAALPAPAPSIAFASPTMSVPEGVGSIANTILLTRDGLAGDVAVNLLYGGTAAYGIDYEKLPRSVTVPAGQNSVSFHAWIVPDLALEPDETIIISAVLPAYPAATATKTITIVDRSGVPATALTFSDGTPLQFSDGSYLELAA
jgi:hypothetical protein